MKNEVAIIDYGINNISSFEKAFNKINIKTAIVKNSEELKKFKHLVLPGVGSFDWGVKNLKKQGLFDAIRYLSKKDYYILGICLGMQLLFEQSEESELNISGLSLLEGKTKKLVKNNENKLIKIPHVGWNSLGIIKKEKILENVQNNANFYFIHSYYVEPKDPEIISATCKHGIEFPAVLESENITGIQFHPEKCHINGLKILEKFSNLN